MGAPSGRLCDAVLKLINLLWIKRKMTGALPGTSTGSGLYVNLFRSLKEVCLVFPQLRKAVMGEMKNILKDPVHNSNQLAELIGIMMGIAFLFGFAPALLI